MRPGGSTDPKGDEHEEGGDPTDRRPWSEPHS
jgi:hypothetical protein